MSNEPTLNSSDELYTDIAFQMFTAYIAQNPQVTSELMDSYTSSNDNDAAFMPGVIFGCMMHMGILLATLAEATNMEIQDAFQLYAKAYNLDLRDRLVNIPALHQDVAKEMFDRISKGEM